MIVETTGLAVGVAVVVTIALFVGFNFIVDITMAAPTAVAPTVVETTAVAPTVVETTAVAPIVVAPTVVETTVVAPRSTTVVSSIRVPYISANMNVTDQATISLIKKILFYNYKHITQLNLTSTELDSLLLLKNDASYFEATVHYFNLTYFSGLKDLQQISCWTSFTSFLATFTLLDTNNAFANIAAFYSANADAVGPELVRVFLKRLPQICDIIYYTDLKIPAEKFGYVRVNTEGDFLVYNKPLVAKNTSVVTRNTFKVRDIPGTPLIQYISDTFANFFKHPTAKVRSIPVTSYQELTNVPIENVVTNVPMENVVTNVPMENVEPSVPIENVEPSVNYSKKTKLGLVIFISVGVFVCYYLGFPAF